VFRTPIGRLRVVAFVEGISYLLLLFVAMPLKYLAGEPYAVTVTGMAHGVLFVAFLGALAHAALVHGWPMRRVAIAFVAAVVPFGTFALDRQLRREQAGLARSAPGGGADRRSAATRRNAPRPTRMRV
jgi:integral membrane protein